MQKEEDRVEGGKTETIFSEDIRHLWNTPATNYREYILRWAVPASRKLVSLLIVLAFMIDLYKRKYIDTTN